MLTPAARHAAMVSPEQSKVSGPAVGEHVRLAELGPGEGDRDRGAWTRAAARGGGWATSAGGGSRRTPAAGVPGGASGRGPTPELELVASMTRGACRPARHLARPGAALPRRGRGFGEQLLAAPRRRRRPRRGAGSSVVAACCCARRRAGRASSTRSRQERPVGLGRGADVLGPAAELVDAVAASRIAVRPAARRPPVEPGRSGADASRGPVRPVPGSPRAAAPVACSAAVARSSRSRVRL